MKRILQSLMIGLLLARFSPVKVYADEVYVYEFDQITITEAYRFQITITDEPVAGSVLEGHVQVNDVLTVYVGSLVFQNEGSLYGGNEKMIVLTKADDTDIARYLLNSMGTDLVTYRGESYGNWKTMDPEVGVVKDFSIPLQYEISIYYHIVENHYDFIDNKNTTYPMMEGTYEYLPDLNLIIKAYVETPIEEPTSSNSSEESARE